MKYVKAECYLGTHTLDYMQYTLFYFHVCILSYSELLWSLQLRTHTAHKARARKYAIETFALLAFFQYYFSFSYMEGFPYVLSGNDMASFCFLLWFIMIVFLFLEAHLISNTVTEWTKLSFPRPVFSFQGTGCNEKPVVIREILVTHFHVLDILCGYGNLSS